MEEDFSWIIPPEKSNRKGRNNLQKKKLRLKLAKKYGCCCYICKREVPFESLTIDHIIRVRDGGSWNIDNLRLACSSCNYNRN
jgi:5-methylcytosine-specific restriction endonuclease McrA